VLLEVGGWDENALTEDTELTFRIYQKGYKVKFIPDAVSEEQEPEKLSTWMRQRTRWARGNNYIIAKFNRSIMKRSNRLISLELMNLFYLYYLFVFAILFSDIIFVLSIFDWVDIKIAGPYIELWILAFLLFALEVILALHYEGEDSLLNFGLTLFAYFTYTKLWVVVVLTSLFQDIILRKERTWAKTERFDSPLLLTEEYSENGSENQTISSEDRTGH
jgi:cellulose synthase/poly-beta-1,6-N-acetylglucosamine synthase-like glycosyltransferase